jgi:hypothetical protein
MDLFTSNYLLKVTFGGLLAFVVAFGGDGTTAPLHPPAFRERARYGSYEKRSHDFLMILGLPEHVRRCRR